jgi:hypothetical protein
MSKCICINKNADGSLVLLELPATIAEAEARIETEQAVLDSCDTSKRINDACLSKGAMAQRDYDAWFKRWEYTQRNAQIKLRALEAWVEAALDATEDDAKAEAMVNELAIARDTIAKLEALVALGDARALNEAKRFIAFREQTYKTIYALEEIKALHGPLPGAAEHLLQNVSGANPRLRYEEWIEGEEAQAWLVAAKRTEKRARRVQEGLRENQEQASAV